MDRRGRHPGRAAAETEGRLSTDDLRLPKPPGFIRSFFNRHPWLLDGFIAAAYAVPVGAGSLFVLITNTVGSSVFSGDPVRGNPLFGVLLMYVTAAVTVALLFRRYVPIVTAAVCAVALVASVDPGNGLDGIPMMFALYALAVYRSALAAWIGTGVAVAAGVFAIAVREPGDLAGIVGFGFLFSLLMVIATLVGISFGNRRRYIQALLDRAAQLARERDQRAQLAAAAERARIAREMHDIVAHSLTVIVALSDGAEASLDRSPDTAREAVRQTAATARRALAEVRRSLGVITDPAPLGPQPGLDELPELVASFRAAGLPVRYTVIGSPQLGTVLQLTVYRVVQEALTNALRYAAAPTAVDVTLRFAPGSTVVEVLDDGADPGRAPASEGSGRGLIGLRERVALHGGVVTAAPVGARGWRVRATIPHGDETGGTDD